MEDASTRFAFDSHSAAAGPASAVRVAHEYDPTYEPSPAEGARPMSLSAGRENAFARPPRADSRAFYDLPEQEPPPPRTSSIMHAYDHAEGRPAVPADRTPRATSVVASGTGSRHQYEDIRGSSDTYEYAYGDTVPQQRSSHASTSGATDTYEYAYGQAPVHSVSSGSASTAAGSYSRGSESYGYSDSGSLSYAQVPVASSAVMSTATTRGSRVISARIGVSDDSGRPLSSFNSITTATTATGSSSRFGSVDSDSDTGPRMSFMSVMSSSSATALLQQREAAHTVPDHQPKGMRRPPGWSASDGLSDEFVGADGSEDASGQRRTSRLAQGLGVEIVDDDAPEDDDDEDSAQRQRRKGAPRSGSIAESFIDSNPLQRYKSSQAPSTIEFRTTQDVDRSRRRKCRVITALAMLFVLIAGGVVIFLGTQQEGVKEAGTWTNCTYRGWQRINQLCASCGTESSPQACQRLTVAIGYVVPSGANVTVLVPGDPPTKCTASGGWATADIELKYPLYQNYSCFLRPSSASSTGYEIQSSQATSQDLTLVIIGGAIVGAALLVLLSLAMYRGTDDRPTEVYSRSSVWEESTADAAKRMKSVRMTGVKRTSHLATTESEQEAAAGHRQSFMIQMDKL
jgi:hypothetical protein